MRHEKNLSSLDESGGGGRRRRRVRQIEEEDDDDEEEETEEIEELLNVCPHVPGKSKVLVFFSV